MDWIQIQLMILQLWYKARPGEIAAAMLIQFTCRSPHGVIAIEVTWNEFRGV